MGRLVILSFANLVGGERPHRLERASIAFGVSLALYSLLLFALRPAAPFEWDEVQFQRALDAYDVAAHWPHPPGYPAYIAAAKVARYLVRDPLLALQLVAIASAVIALAATWAIVRRLGASSAVAGGACALLASMPGFMFYGNIGMSDVPGTTAGVLTVLAAVVALDDPRWLPVAAAAAGVAVGVRPQIAPIFLVVLVWACVRALRARRYGIVALALAIGVATTAICWVSAIVATGPQRWWNAVSIQTGYVQRVERGYRLPSGSIREVLRWWIVKSLVGWQFALPLWTMALAGAAALFRAGRARLAAVVLSSFALYEASAWFSMNSTSAVRYALPAMPFVAIAAAGGLAASRPLWRRVTGGLVAVWALAAVAWGSPAYRGRLKPAPVWSALEWVASNLEPGRTLVISDGVPSPHLAYVLERAGFHVLLAERVDAFALAEKFPGATLFITGAPVPGTEVLFHARYESRRVLQLAWNRFGECTVARVPRGDMPACSPEWQLVDGAWHLWATGPIEMPAEAWPRKVTLRTEHGPLTVERAGARAVEIGPWLGASFPLFPGLAGALVVTAPPNWWVRMPAPRIERIGVNDFPEHQASTVVVPLVARDHTAGYDRRTDLVVFNPGDVPLPIVAQYLAAGRDNSAAPFVRASVGARGRLDVRDVLGTVPQFAGGPETGALVIRVDREGLVQSGASGKLLVFSRTYALQAERPHYWVGDGIPGVALEAGVPTGATASITGLVPRDGGKTGVGVASWCEREVRVEITIGKPGREVPAGTVTVPPFGHAFTWLAGPVADGAVGVRAVSGPDTARLFPYATALDGKTGAESHRLPDRLELKPVPAPLGSPRLAR